MLIKLIDLLEVGIFDLDNVFIIPVENRDFEPRMWNIFYYAHRL